MTPLRNKMIRELELHRKAPGTIKAYVTAVAQLARLLRAFARADLRSKRCETSSII